MLNEIIADFIEIIGDIVWQISVTQPKPQTLYSLLTKHWVLRRFEMRQAQTGLVTV